MNFSHVVMENKERALNLLIETYKLYAGFSAIIIAGLLSYASGNSQIADDNLLYTSIVVLCLASCLCVFGIQYFISRVNKGDYNIYSIWAKGLTFFIMVFLFLGLLFSFLYIYNYRESTLNSQKTEITQTSSIKKDCHPNMGAASSPSKETCNDGKPTLKAY